MNAETWTVTPAEASLMVSTGFATRASDGALDLTPEGRSVAMDYLRRRLTV